MSRIAAVTGAACGDGDRHIVAAGQTRAAPADELIMIPCGIVQRDVVGLDGIAGGVFRRAAVQVVRNLILLQFAHEGRHIQAFVALQAQRIDGIRDLIARRNGVVAGANHDLRAGHGGAGIFCQKRALFIHKFYGIAQIAGFAVPERDDVLRCSRFQFDGFGQCIGHIIAVALGIGKHSGAHIARAHNFVKQSFAGIFDEITHRVAGHCDRHPLGVQRDVRADGLALEVITAACEAGVLVPAREGVTLTNGVRRTRSRFAAFYLLRLHGGTAVGVEGHRINRRRPLGIDDQVAGRHGRTAEIHLRSGQAVLCGVPALEGVVLRQRGRTVRRVVLIAQAGLIQQLGRLIHAVVVVERQVIAVARIVQRGLSSAEVATSVSECRVGAVAVEALNGMELLVIRQVVDAGGNGFVQREALSVECGVTALAGQRLYIIVDCVVRVALFATESHVGAGHFFNGRQDVLVCVSGIFPDPAGIVQSAVVTHDGPFVRDVCIILGLDGGDSSPSRPQPTALVHLERQRILVTGIIHIDDGGTVGLDGHGVGALKGKIPDALHVALGELYLLACRGAPAGHRFIVGIIVVIGIFQPIDDRIAHFFAGPFGVQGHIAVQRDRGARRCVETFVQIPALKGEAVAHGLFVRHVHRCAILALLTGNVASAAGLIVQVLGIAQIADGHDRGAVCRDGRLGIGLRGKAFPVHRSRLCVSAHQALLLFPDFFKGAVQVLVFVQHGIVHHARHVCNHIAYVRAGGSGDLRLAERFTVQQRCVTRDGRHVKGIRLARHILAAVHRPRCGAVFKQVIHRYGPDLLFRLTGNRLYRAPLPKDRSSRLTGSRRCRLTGSRRCRLAGSGRRCLAGSGRCRLTGSGRRCLAGSGRCCLAIRRRCRLTGSGRRCLAGSGRYLLVV